MRLIDADALSQIIETMYLGNDTKNNHRVCAETEDTMIGKFQVIDTIFGIPPVFEIPNNATNGEVVENLFSEEDVELFRLFMTHKWWNESYKKGEDNGRI